MKRILFALGVGVTMFAIVAYAASLNVGWGTAATGQGTVSSCGDVTGSTYVLKGQSVLNGAGGDDYLSGFPTDITTITHVNIETVAGCDKINAFVQLKTAGGTSLATGSCQISGDDTPEGGAVADDGLGYDEAATWDNLPGCTAVLSVEVPVAWVGLLVVTMT